MKIHKTGIRKVGIPLGIIVIGLVMYSVSSAKPDMTLLAINFSTLLNNLGTLFIFLAPLQYYFDATSKVDLSVAIANETIGNLRISQSGLCDIILASRDVDYSDAILHSANLVVAANYSFDWAKRHIDDLKSRARAGLQTEFLILSPNSHFSSCLPNNKTAADISASHKAFYAELKRDFGEHFKTICFREFDANLHYSFVTTDHHIWIRPYCNSSGRRTIPVFKVKKGTSLFTFYEEDIAQLKNSAVQVAYP